MAEKVEEMIKECRECRESFKTWGGNPDYTYGTGHLVTDNQGRQYISRPTSRGHNSCWLCPIEPDKLMEDKRERQLAEARWQASEIKTAPVYTELKTETGHLKAQLRWLQAKVEKLEDNWKQADSEVRRAGVSTEVKRG